MSAAAPSLRTSTPEQRRTLAAAALGWMLDAFDVMLYSLVLADIMKELGMSLATGGILNALTLVASGIGGLLFGFLADRIGRTRALALSILTYSVCSFASGLSTSILMLAVFRFILGLGMGGEWNTGATLVAETWPKELRAKAIAIVQSSYAIGYAVASLVAGIMLRFTTWRYVFFVGIIPALLTLWIQKTVPESDMWREHHRLATDLRRVAEAQHKYEAGAFGQLFRPPYFTSTMALLLVNFFGMFAWWGLFTWVPTYFVRSVDKGGLGFSLNDKTILLLVLNLVGMFPGYATFGWAADRLGRRKAFVVYLVAAAVLVPFYAMARNYYVIMALGAVVAFFGTGFFSGSGIVGSEIFPTRLRARALGFTYPGARMLSAVSPYIIGRLGDSYGLSAGFYLCAGSFLIAAGMAMLLPETKGKELE